MLRVAFGLITLYEFHSCMDECEDLPCLYIYISYFIEIEFPLFENELNEIINEPLTLFNLKFISLR